MEENAAVAIGRGVGGPTPLDVEAIVAVARGGGEVTYGFSGKRQDAGILVAPSRRSDGSAGSGGKGDKFPAGEVATIEQVERFGAGLGANGGAAKGEEETEAADGAHGKFSHKGST